MNKYFYVLSGIIIYMCIGSIYSWSVFRKPLEELLKITATQSGIPYMLFLLFFSFTMPFAGRFMEKIGAFRTILIGNLFFLTGFIISGLTGNILSISLSYGMLSGIGVGIIYGVPIAVVSKWFTENKGFAMGLTLIGFGLSPFITAPVIKNFINLYGPINTFLIIGIIFFILILSVSLKMEFPQTEKVNQSVSIEEAKENILKTKKFYGLWLCYIFGAFAGLLVIGITSPYAQEIIKLNSNVAAFYVSFFAIFNGIGRPLFGFLVDRLKPLNTIILSYLLIILASTLAVFGKGSIIAFIFSFSLIWLTFGGWLALAPATTLHIWGAKNYTKNYGIVFTAYGIAAVAGTLISGIIKDLLGSYLFVFYPVLILAVAGIFIAFLTLRQTE